MFFCATDWLLNPTGLLFLDRRLFKHATRNQLSKAYASEGFDRYYVEGSVLNLVRLKQVTSAPVEECPGHSSSRRLGLMIRPVQHLQCSIVYRACWVTGVATRGQEFSGDCWHGVLN